jgi:hypothetical protein
MGLWCLGGADGCTCVYAAVGMLRCGGDAVVWCSALTFERLRLVLYGSAGMACCPVLVLWVSGSTVVCAVAWYVQWRARGGCGGAGVAAVRIHVYVCVCVYVCACTTKVMGRVARHSTHDSCRCTTQVRSVQRWVSVTIGQGGRTVTV